VADCQLSDARYERLRVADRLGAVWRQLKFQGFRCAALPADVRFDSLCSGPLVTVMSVARRSEWTPSGRCFVPGRTWQVSHRATPAARPRRHVLPEPVSPRRFLPSHPSTSAAPARSRQTSTRRKSTLRVIINVKHKVSSKRSASGNSSTSGEPIIQGSRASLP
jgi:hypothetical protein